MQNADAYFLKKNNKLPTGAEKRFYVPQEWKQTHFFNKIKLLCTHNKHSSTNPMTA